eukprot:973591-Prymnesium_polylepis.1
MWHQRITFGCHSACGDNLRCVRSLSGHLNESCAVVARPNGCRIPIVGGLAFAAGGHCLSTSTVGGHGWYAAFIVEISTNGLGSATGGSLLGGPLSIGGGGAKQSFAVVSHDPGYCLGTSGGGRWYRA